MIIANKAYEVGDVIEIEVRIDRQGVYNLTSISDFTENETIDSYFTKTVEVSTDSGISYTAPVEVDNASISLNDVTVTALNNIIYLFKYTVTGIQPTEPLIFNSLQIDGTITVVRNKQIVVYSIKVTGEILLY